MVSEMPVDVVDTDGFPHRLDDTAKADPARLPFGPALGLSRVVTRLLWSTSWPRWDSPSSSATGMEGFADQSPGLAISPRSW